MNEKQNRMRYTIVTLLFATLLVLTIHAIGQEPQVLSLHSQIPLTSVKHDYQSCGAARSLLRRIHQPSLRRLCPGWNHENLRWHQFSPSYYGEVP
jgi:hypothetical protein